MGCGQGSEIAIAPDAPIHGPTRVAFDPDRKTVASMSAGHVFRWDLATGKLRQKIAAPELADLAGNFPCSVDQGIGFDGPWCALDKKAMVKAFRNGVVELQLGLFDLKSQQLIRSFKAGDDKLQLQSLALSPDKKLLAGVGMESEGAGILCVWNLAQGREIRRLRLPNNSASIIAFSADGRTIVTVDGAVNGSVAGNTIDFRFWELATATERGRTRVKLKANPPWLFECYFDRLAAMTTQNQAYLVDLHSGAELRSFEGHAFYIQCLAFSADGKHLATGSSDSTVLVWDLANLAKKISDGKLAERELLQHWETLASADAAKAFQSVRRLAESGSQAVRFFNGRLSPARDLVPVNIPRLLADLNSDNFVQRDKATQELMLMGTAAEGPLEKLLNGNPTQETRERAQMLLGKIRDARNGHAPIPTGEILRAVRAIEVLEKIASPEALTLLARLAQGTATSQITCEAQASLDRSK